MSHNAEKAEPCYCGTGIEHDVEPFVVLAAWGRRARRTGVQRCWHPTRSAPLGLRERRGLLVPRIALRLWHHPNMAGPPRVRQSGVLGLR